MKWEISMRGIDALKYFITYDLKFQASLINNPIMYNKIMNVYKRKDDLFCITYIGHSQVRHSFDDLPAIQYIGGSKCWYKFGKLHRDTVDSNGASLPAVERYNGEKDWCKNGVMIRSSLCDSKFNHN